MAVSTTFTHNTHVSTTLTHTAAVSYGFRSCAFPAPFPLTLTNSPFMLSPAPDWEFGVTLRICSAIGIPQTHSCTLSHTHTYTIYMHQQNTHPRISIYTHFRKLLPASQWEFTGFSIISHMFNCLKAQSIETSRTVDVLTCQKTVLSLFSLKYNWTLINLLQYIFGWTINKYTKSQISGYFLWIFVNGLWSLPCLQGRWSDTLILWHAAGQCREEWQPWLACAGRGRGQANLRPFCILGPHLFNFL